MSVVYYPAVFHKEDNGYYVEFPDLPGCLTSGETIEECFKMAEEALGLYLDKSEDIYENNIKEPSSINLIREQFKNEEIMLIKYDSIAYAKKFKNRAIKKTLTIPEWLNDLAQKENVNYSKVLQDALIAKLEIR